MKTMFMFVPSRQNNHVGEDYDNHLEVPEIPTATDFKDIADIVRNRIRGLWNSMPVDDPCRKVVVTLDGHAPYSVILVDLKILMKAEEQIDIELRGTIIDGERELQDPETISLLNRMGGQYAK